MHRYYNKTEVNTLILMLHLITQVDRCISTWNLPIEINKRFKTSMTQLRNGINLLNEYKDKEQVDRTLKAITETEVLIKPLKNLKYELKVMQEEEASKEITLTLNELYSLAEHSMVGCVGDNCTFKRDKRNNKECNIRKMYIDLGFPPVDTNPPKDTCEYWLQKTYKKE